MLISSSHSTIADSGTAGAPDWVHLIPAGSFGGTDGRGPYQLRDAIAVMAASLSGGSKLPVDENHATDHAMATGQPSPARGWIVEMQSREDGIWGRVEWTDSGRALMSEKAYRGISPVFTHAKDGTVLSVLRAALTNTPNLAQLHTLHSTTGQHMNIAQLRAALGLPETADEAACLAAVTANAAAVATHSSEISAIALAAGIEAGAPDVIITALQTQRTQMVPVGQVVALQTQLNTMVAQQANAAAVTFIDAAIVAGKPITPVREQFIAQHVANPTATEALVNGMPSILAAGGTPRTTGTDPLSVEAMSAEDKAVCQRMGLDPVKFAAHQKKMRETKEGTQA